MCDVHGPHDDAVERGVARMIDFVDELVVTITNIRIYHDDHPRVATALRSLMKCLADQFVGSETDAIEIAAADGYLYYRDRPLLGATLSAPRILGPLSELGSGGLRFARTAEERDFVALAHLLGQKPQKAADFREANLVLAKAGCASILLLPLRRTESGAVDGRGTGGGDGTHEERGTGNLAETLDLQTPIELYRSVVDHLQDVTVRVCSGGSLSLEEPKGHVEAVLRMLEEDAKAMMSLSRYEQYDAFTFGHSIRVCFLALNFAKALTDDVDLQIRIGTAALLHDVGKAWVPFEILHAKGRLTDDERLEMNRHSAYGGEILLGMESSDPLSVAIAFGHHRTLQSGGYPRAIHEARLSAVTRIVKICDVFEALTAVRPYKPRMSPTRAYRIMLTMEDHFDPMLLREFIDTTGLYPIGSRVRLSNGDTARVRRQTEVLHRPVVDVELVMEGDALTSSEALSFDLSAQGGTEALEVEELLLDAEF
ncbi:MAG: HD-GYP domain-containing protein [Planctomycetota bacterium]|jgi:HD-GYP domain-containing protein (c-di-GMP phosphodiesterase class II)